MPCDNNLSGMFLDADDERIIHIKLPVITRIIDGKKRKYGELALIGDFHYGHENFARTVLNGYLNYFKKNKHIQFGFMGDYINYAEGNVRHIRNETISIDKQIEQFSADWRPFAKRIKFMLVGNHEDRFAKLTKSEMFPKWLGMELGLPEEIIGKHGRGFFLVIHVGSKIYGGYVHHGSTNARINRKLQLQRMAKQHGVMFVAHGHTHELSWGERQTIRNLEFVNDEIKNVVRRQYLIATGCFIKYPAYAEAKSYPYTDVGCPILRFYADNSEFEIRDLTAQYKNFRTGGLPWKGQRKPLSKRMRKLLNRRKYGVIEACLSEK